MNEVDLHRTTPEATNPRHAILKDHKLAFTAISLARKGAVADIVESSGDVVEGIVWEVADFQTLDHREGHPYVYQRREIAVEIDGINEVVNTYSVVYKNRSMRPSKEYLDLILNPALPLTPTYLEKIEAHANWAPVAESPDPPWRVIYLDGKETWAENFFNIWDAVDCVLYHEGEGRQAQLIHRPSGDFHEARRPDVTLPR